MAYAHSTNEPVLLVRSPEEVSKIHQTQSGAVLWERSTRPAFQDWLDGLSPDELPSIRTEVCLGEIKNILNLTCDKVGTPNTHERGKLIDDIEELAQAFAKVMNVSCLKLRLDVVQTNACKKFHVDYLVSRLVCTYRGTGTEYVILGNNEEPQAISNVPTGSAFLMKGKLWSDQSDFSLHHRSPAIEGTGETRLVLVLDPIFNEPE